MARAHFVTYLLDSEGRPIPGATVDVREPDTETLISETVYAEDDTAGSTELGNPFTAAADGKCEIWLTAPKIVDLYVTKTGYEPSTIRAVAHQLTASTQTVADGGVPLAQRTTLNFIGGFILADDAGNDETEIDLDYAETADISTQAFGDAADAGSGAEVPRAGHKHGMPADPVIAHEATFAHGDIAGHIADTGDAHDASAISIADAAGDFTATDVEGALAELQSDAEADAAALTTHVDDASGAHLASAIGLTDAGGQFTAADVEGALAEAQTQLDLVDSTLTSHIGDGTDAHDASAISVADAAGHFSATNVETVLNELASDIIIKVKGANETVTSSTVLQSDNELFFSVAANETWEVELVLRVTSASATPDFKWAFTIPASASLVFGIAHHYFPGATAQTGMTLKSGVDAIGGDSAGVLAAVDSPVFLKGIYDGGASSGTVQLQWAQNTSDANGTTVSAESYLIARRVG